MTLTVVPVEAGTLLAATAAAGLAGSVVLLVAGLTGGGDPAAVTTAAARPPTRLQRAQAGITSPGLAARIGAGALAAALTLLVTRWPVAAVGIGALVAWWPKMFGGTRAEQLQIDRLEALVTWTEALRDVVAAHAGLEHAIPATTANAPELIRPALVRLSGQIRARTPLDVALQGLAAELDDASADLVIAALILNVRRRGDRLTEVLSGLATTAREELDLRRRVSAGRAGLRRGVQIVIGITIAFAVFLVVFGDAYVQPYSTPAGQLALTVVVGMFAAGFTWMRRLSAADPAPAFLHRPGGSPVADPVGERIVAALTGVTGGAGERS